MNLQVNAGSRREETLAQVYSSSKFDPAKFAKLILRERRKELDTRKKQREEENRKQREEQARNKNG